MHIGRVTTYEDVTRKLLPWNLALTSSERVLGHDRLIWWDVDGSASASAAI